MHGEYRSAHLVGRTFGEVVPSGRGGLLNKYTLPIPTHVLCGLVFIGGGGTVSSDSANPATGRRNEVKCMENTDRHIWWDVHLVRWYPQAEGGC